MLHVEYGTVFSHLTGTPVEIWDAHQALIPPGDEEEVSLLREDGSFYTGLIPYLRSKLNHPIEVKGEPTSPFFAAPIDVPPELLGTDQEPDFRLRDYQASAIRKALMAGRGVVEIATGGGKTEVAAGILVCLFWKKHIRRALYLVGTAHLLNQSVERLQRRGVQDVGVLGDGKRRIGKARVVVATVQSVNKCLNWGDEQVHEYLQTTDALFMDEVHHAQARTWTVLAEACHQATWRFGMTATLWDDPRGYAAGDLALLGLLGPPVAQVSMRALITRGFLAEPTVFMPPLSSDKVLVHPKSFNAWFRTYRNGIVRHTQRNSLVLSYARYLYARSYRTLVFTAQVEHGAFLLACLAKLGIEEALFLSGGSQAEFYVDGKKQAEHWNVQKIAKYIETHERCVIVGTPVMDEGLDFPGLNCLIMAGAMQKYRRTVQRMGRGLRPKPGTNRVIIIDPFDLTHPFLQAHAAYRRWTYEAEGLVIHDRAAEVFEDEVPVDLGLVASLGVEKALVTKAARPFSKGRRSYR